MNKEKIVAFIMYFIIGIGSGIIYFVCLKNNIKLELKELVNNTPIGYNNIYFHLLITIIMFLLAFIIIGYLINYIYLYFEFFTIGFSLAFFFYNNSFNGIIYGLLFNLIYKGLYLFLLIFFIRKLSKLSRYHYSLLRRKPFSYKYYRSLFIYPLLFMILIIINDLGLIVLNDYFIKLLKNIM